MSIRVRPIEARDEARWRVLWDGYCRFYERDLSGPITQHTWNRIVDTRSPVSAIVAESDADGVIGIANYLLHENTWTLKPVCYLEDLFVDPGERARGVGKQLIDWLVARMKSEGWSRLYWNTREDNYRARGLYDKYDPPRSPRFVKYTVVNPDC